MLNLNLWFIVPKNVSKPLFPHPLGQSPSFDQFEFWPLRRRRPARVMPFYLGALRMLNVATDTVKTLYLVQNWTGNTLVKVSDRYVTYLRHYDRVKPKCHFSRKFELWPDLTRSNIDLGPKNMCNCEISSRRIDWFFPWSSTTIRGRSPGVGGRTNPPPPLTVRVMRNALTGRGLNHRRLAPRFALRS